MNWQTVRGKMTNHNEVICLGLKSHCREDEFFSIPEISAQICKPNTKKKSIFLKAYLSMRRLPKLSPLGNLSHGVSFRLISFSGALGL